MTFVDVFELVFGKELKPTVCLLAELSELRFFASSDASSVIISGIQMNVKKRKGSVRDTWMLFSSCTR